MTERGAWRAAKARTVVSLVAFVGVVALAASAQESEPVQLPWQAGPGTASIGDGLAEIELEEGYIFLDAEGTQQLLELTQNLVSGNEMATIARTDDSGWFLIFEFDETGYIPDDEKDDLDADGLLASIREGTEAANEERRERGWDTMTIVGWHEPPHYDERTNNLSWAIKGQSSSGQNVNRIVKLLGRRGVMTATLVASPEELAAAVPAVDSVLMGYRYQPGNTYAEYIPGSDKLAEYGLGALVVGGVGAALVKSGLLARLWKPIAVGLVALAAGVRRFFFGGRSSDHDLEKPIT